MMYIVRLNRSCVMHDWCRNIHVNKPLSMKFDQLPIVPAAKRCAKRISKPLRRKLWERDNRSCLLCSKSLPIENIEIDHICPRVLGGKTRSSNLRVLCTPCHTAITQTLNHQLNQKRSKEYSHKMRKKRKRGKR